MLHYVAYKLICKVAARGHGQPGRDSSQACQSYPADWVHDECDFGRYRCQMTFITGSSAAEEAG
jgi:hypothetical protein